MKASLLLGLLMLVPAATAGGDETFACNMTALTRSERTHYGKLPRRLMDAVEERRELKNGYGFRLPATMLVSAAEWVSFERRCCPFFTFALDIGRDGGPVWLEVTGSKGVKEFIRAEFGLE